MGVASSVVPPPGTSTSGDPIREPSSSDAAEAAQTEDFREGVKRGVYREKQGDLLYVTKNRAKPHRCNDRVEDVIQALFEGNPLLTVPPALAMARRCVASEPGKEPEEPYLYLDLPPPRRAEAVTGREPGKKPKARWFGRSRDEATRRASEESP